MKSERAERIEEKIEAVKDLDAAGLLTPAAVARVLDLEDFNPTQKFFDGLAAESRKVHFGDHQKRWTENLLKRAQEAGIYVPATA